MVRIIAPVLVVVTVGGCTQAMWTKSGFAEDEWRRDTYACERDARQSGYFGTGWVAQMNMEKFYARCLQSKGYYQVRQ